MAPVYAGPSLFNLREIPLTSSEDRAVHVLGDEPSKDFFLTHLELRKCCARFVWALRAQFLESGVRAGIVLANSPEFLVAFLGVTGVGGVAAPLNPAYKLDEFTFYLRDSRASLVIVSLDINEDAPVIRAAKKLNINVFRMPEDALIPGNSSGDCSYDLPNMSDPDSEAMFLHTSGTTSRPKGVPLSHRNLCASIRNISRTYELTRDDRSLLVMPLFHVHGLMSAALSTLATGGAVVFPPGGKFSASKFWPSIVRGEVTWFTAVPTIHQILLARADEDYPAGEKLNLRFVRSCSASLAPIVLERMEATFRVAVLEAYAMTEAAHQMTSNPLPKHGARIAGSVGKAQNVEVCVLNDRNEKVRHGRIGEVCIRGENVTSGYENNAEANAAAFAGGWFHTGDQGRLDAEGYLTLTGRIKELVNRGGEKISPLEVDAILLAHESVAEAVSFAVPDDHYGEEVNAAVILKKGRKVTNEGDLKMFASERLASFKVPKKIFICDFLPKTATGKIQRRVVSQHFVGWTAAD